jgi:hypothetical protein
LRLCEIFRHDLRISGHSAHFHSLSGRFHHLSVSGCLRFTSPTKPAIVTSSRKLSNELVSIYLRIPISEIRISGWNWPKRRNAGSAPIAVSTMARCPQEETRRGSAESSCWHKVSRSGVDLCCTAYMFGRTLLRRVTQSIYHLYKSRFVNSPALAKRHKHCARSKSIQLLGKSGSRYSWHGTCSHHACNCRGPLKEV